MRNCIYQTDPEWVRFLREDRPLGEVNFWRKDTRRLSLEPGAGFYFKIRGSREIVGRGRFHSMEVLSIDEAWNRFGRTNGVASKEDLEKRAFGVLNIDASIKRLACLVLVDLEFLTPDRYYRLSDEEFPDSVQGGKFFDDEDIAPVASLFHHAAWNERLRRIPEIEKGVAESLPFAPESLEDKRESILRSVVQRRGQPKFRNELLAAYDYRCAITGTEVEDVLEAAHIVPYLGPETNHLTNGLLLRADIHTLLDLGLLAVDEDRLEVIVTPLLRSSSYGELHGKKLRLPIAEGARPSRAALKVHREESGL